MAEEQNVELATPAGSLKIKGTDIIGILTLIAVVTLGLFVYTHVNDSADKSGRLVTVLTEMKEQSKEAGKQQRLMTCILSRKEVERVKEFESPNSFCQQISK